MGNVNWDDVPQPDQEEASPKGNVLGTIAFVLLLLVGSAAGGAYLNVVMLSERVRDLVVAECADPTCAVDVRAKHADCFDASVSYATPASLEDFQTPSSVPKLGIGSVKMDTYRPCVMPSKPKTLAEQE